MANQQQHKNLLQQVEEAIKNASLTMVALQSEIEIIDTAIKHEEETLHPALITSSKTLSQFHKDNAALLTKMNNDEYFKTTLQNNNNNNNNNEATRLPLPSLEARKSTLIDTLESSYENIMESLNSTKKRIRRCCTLPLMNITKANKDFIDETKKLEKRRTAARSEEIIYNNNTHERKQQQQQDSSSSLSSYLQQDALSSYASAVEESISIDQDEEGAAFMMLLNQFVEKNKK